ncbi:putative phosphatidate phosphatase [Bradysia coprophila]|uniref:putative phosphatidate phosphatase n=1 Tax=Bradysia coprophila TaxID=38358 RepID=UPI00187DA181|nr:putative phosphatidate phosphatase [Bradysia coprophila]XP_037049002.1 putative phosphatidate phosphatase [Bradysia coprophila]
MNVQRIAYFALEASVLIVIFVFWRMGDWIIPHTKIGFFCGDPSLSYPYKTASIPQEWLNISAYVCSVLIWVIELTLESLNGRTDLKKRLLRTTVRCLQWIVYYYTTLMILNIFLILLKNLVGGLRPMFLQLCQPDLAVNCTVGQFIDSDYECTNPVTTELLLFEIRRSFPSGHAMASVYITVFFMRYLEARFAKFRVTLTAVHFVCSIWIVVSSVSRITEHYHHVWDVIAGIILALPFVFYSSQIQCKGFRSTKLKIEEQLGL